MVASAAAAATAWVVVSLATVRIEVGGEWSWTQPKPAASYDLSSGAEAHHSFGKLSPSLRPSRGVCEPGSARAAATGPVVCSTAIETRFALEAALSVKRV